jgi:holliday junction DNA helicase RuvA
MIAHLHGTVSKLQPGEVTVDVGGVGYRVLMPLDAWDAVTDAKPAFVWIYSYIREDRFDLFGFMDRTGRTLFEEFLKLDGVGPKMALELCGAPRSLMHQAIVQEDLRFFTGIKGVGKKTAERLLIELKSLNEKHPHLFATAGGTTAKGVTDHDAVAALTALGYDPNEVTRVLRELPTTLTATEDRVAAALRAL